MYVEIFFLLCLFPNKTKYISISWKQIKTWLVQTEAGRMLNTPPPDWMRWAFIWVVSERTLVNRRLRNTFISVDHEWMPISGEEAPVCNIIMTLSNHCIYLRSSSFSLLIITKFWQNINGVFRHLAITWMTCFKSSSLLVIIVEGGHAENTPRWPMNPICSHNRLFKSKPPNKDEEDDSSQAGINNASKGGIIYGDYLQVHPSCAPSFELI